MKAFASCVFFCLSFIFVSIAEGASSYQEYQDSLRQELCLEKNPDQNRKAACLCIQEEESLSKVLQCIREKLSGENKNQMYLELQREIQESRLKSRSLLFQTDSTAARAEFNKRFPRSYTF